MAFSAEFSNRYVFYHINGLIVSVCFCGKGTLRRYSCKSAFLPVNTLGDVVELA